MTLRTGLFPFSTKAENHSSQQKSNPSLALVDEILSSVHHEAIPPTLLRELKSLSKEADVEILEEALFSLARRAENLKSTDLSDSIYQALSSKGQTPIQEESRKSLLAHSGKGDFKDVFAYGVNRFGKELSDPANILSTLAGVGAFRATRFLSGVRFLGTAGKFSRLSVSETMFSNLVGYSTAPVAAVLAEKSVRHILGSQEDWSSQGLKRELATNMLAYGLILGTARNFRYVGRQIGIKEASTLEKAGIGLGVFIGSVTSNALAISLKFSPASEHQDVTLIADGAAQTLHFFLARYLSNKLGGGNFLGKETAMFGRGIFTPHYY